MSGYQAPLINYGNAEDFYWHPGTMEARLNVDVEGKRVVFRVSAEAITDHLEPIDETPEELLNAAKRHFDRLTDLLGGKLTRKCTERDGSVLLRNKDLL